MKYYICDREYFWTGRNWTSINQFAEKYSFWVAFNIRVNRFKSKPKVKIVSVKIIENRKKKQKRAEERRCYLAK